MGADLRPEQDSAASRPTRDELPLGKPVIYVANVDEAGLAEDNDYTHTVRCAAEQATW